MRWLCFFTLFLLLASALEFSTVEAKRHTKRSTRKAVRPKTVSAAKKAPAGPSLPKTASNQGTLDPAYYSQSCPNVENIIQRKVNAWIQKDKTLAPSLIRLHFHDCVVRGCDASILLNHTGGEMAAEASKTLRGFQVIEDIKTELEKECPRKVSCADILTTVARDATLAVNGPFWEVPFGRKDGLISLSKEADIVPQGHESITQLLQLFTSMGLNELDLVVLSGSHTIGRSSCFAFQQRLANQTNTLDPGYANFLKRQCKNANNLVNLDVTTPETFDTVFYTNLQKKMGLLSTDQLLMSDSRTSPFVGTLASQQQLFFTQFAASMVRLGNIQVVDRKIKGEVRVNCNLVNK